MIELRSLIGNLTKDEVIVLVALENGVQMVFV